MHPSILQKKKKKKKKLIKIILKKKKKKEFKLVFKIYSFILVAFIHSGKHGEI